MAAQVNHSFALIIVFTSLRFGTTIYTRLWGCQVYRKQEFNVAQGQRCSLETQETLDSSEDYILDNAQGLYLFC
jgi:hypothetical protein